MSQLFDSLRRKAPEKTPEQLELEQELARIKASNKRAMETIERGMALLSGAPMPPTPEEEASARREIERLNEKERTDLGKGMDVIGFRLERWKNERFAKWIDEVVKTRDKKSTFSRFCLGLKAGFISNAKDAQRKGLAIKQGEDTKLTHVRSLGLLSGNLIRYGRLAADVGLMVWRKGQIVNPMRWAMLGSMAAAQAAQAGKEGRLMNEEVIEKTRFGKNDMQMYKEDEDDDTNVILDSAVQFSDEIAKAQEEAFALNPGARNADEFEINVTADKKMSAEDIKKAYLRRIPGDLLKRLETPGVAKNFIEKVIGLDIRNELKRLEGRINEIEARTDISPEKKSAQIDSMLIRWQKRLEDYDRIISRYGTIDLLAASGFFAQTAGRTAVHAMQVETAVITLDKIWDTVAHVYNSSDFSVGKIFTREPAQSGQSAARPSVVPQARGGVQPQPGGRAASPQPQAGRERIVTSPGQTPPKVATPPTTGPGQQSATPQPEGRERIVTSPGQTPPTARVVPQPGEKVTPQPQPGRERIVTSPGQTPPTPRPVEPPPSAPPRPVEPPPKIEKPAAPAEARDPFKPPTGKPAEPPVEKPEGSRPPTPPKTRAEKLAELGEKRQPVPRPPRVIEPEIPSQPEFTPAAAETPGAVPILSFDDLPGEKVSIGEVPFDSDNPVSELSPARDLPGEKIQIESAESPEPVESKIKINPRDIPLNREEIPIEAPEPVPQKPPAPEVETQRERVLSQYPAEETSKPGRVDIAPDPEGTERGIGGRIRHKSPLELAAEQGEVGTYRPYNDPLAGHYPDRVRIFPDLNEMENRIIQSHEEFADNPYDLSGRELIESYRVQQNNLSQIFPGQEDMHVWETRYSEMKAGDVLKNEKVGMGEIQGRTPYGRLFNHMKYLEQVTGLKPKRGLFGLNPETVEEYMARAVQKAARIRGGLEMITIPR